MRIMLISIEWLLFFGVYGITDKIWNDNARMSSQVGRVAFDHWNERFIVHEMRSNDDHYVPLLSTDQGEKPRIYRMVKNLKCNVDAVFFVDSGRTLVGACFLNSSGEFTDGFTQ
jgi:hypothetical protein